MFERICIKNNQSKSLLTFLEDNNYQTETLTEQVVKITRDDELPVYVQTDENSLYFEVDLGNISELDSKEIYFQLLDLNTEILPVSVGIDLTNEEDPRLVLVESREHKNLDENEVLSVLNALEIAVDKVEAILAQYVK